MSNGYNPGSGISGQDASGKTAAGNKPAWGAKVLPLLPGGIEVISIGGGFYRLNIPRHKHVVGDNKENYVIPFPHKLHVLYVQYVDGNLDVTAKELTYTMKYLLRDNIFFTLVTFKTIVGEEILIFGTNEGVRDPGVYQFDYTAFTDYYVYTTMIVEALGEI